MNISSIANNDKVEKTVNKNGMFHVFFGLLVITAYCAQAVSEWQWEYLYLLQENFIYKQVSGFVLVAAVLWQWRLYVYRHKIISDSRRKILNSHEIFGPLSLILFYLHSAEFGFALQLVLSISYISTILSGLVKPNSWGIRNRFYINVWLVVHVLSATLMTNLAIYHIYISYWYG